MFSGKKYTYRMGGKTLVDFGPSASARVFALYIIALDRCATVSSRRIPFDLNEIVVAVLDTWFARSTGAV